MSEPLVFDFQCMRIFEDHAEDDRVSAVVSGSSDDGGEKVGTYA